MNANTLLHTFADHYWHTRDAKPGWRDQLKYTSTHFSKYLGRPATLADLTVDTVNAWLAWMCASSLSRHSVRSRRRVLLVLWRAAADRDLVAMLPERKIRKVSAPPLIPQFLVRQAGLKGSSKTLRKTGATLCEVATPGSASAFLGHRDPALAVRHYLDPSKIQATKARPPRLGGGA